MDTTTTANPVTSSTRAALLILEHAERTGLPLPFNVQTTDWTGSVSFLFASLASLTEWAQWLDAPIGELDARDSVHHIVTGVALDQHIRCTYVATKRTAVA